MSCDCEKDKHFSLAEAAKSISKVVTSAVKVATIENYNPFVSKAESERRMETCRNCELHMIILSKLRCKVCGCFLGAKTTLKDQSCPHPDGPKW